MTAHRSSCAAAHQLCCSVAVITGCVGVNAGDRSTIFCTTFRCTAPGSCGNAVMQSRCATRALSMIRQYIQRFEKRNGPVAHILPYTLATGQNVARRL
jgi:hypothetical protein